MARQEWQQPSCNASHFGVPAICQWLCHYVRQLQQVHDRGEGCEHSSNIGTGHRGVHPHVLWKERVRLATFHLDHQPIPHSIRRLQQRPIGGRTYGCLQRLQWLRQRLNSHYSIHFEYIDECNKSAAIPERNIDAYRNGHLCVSRCRNEVLRGHSR